MLATTQAEPKPDRPLSEQKKGIQLNTLRAMKSLPPQGAVVPIVFAETVEWADTVRAENAGVVQQFENRTSTGYPTFRGIMKQMEKTAKRMKAPFFGYINGDIMLTEDLLVTLRLVHRAHRDHFFGDRAVFMIGRRSVNPSCPIVCLPAHRCATQLLPLARMNFPAQDHVNLGAQSNRCTLAQQLEMVVKDGALFCPCALDYFIASPGAFDWDKLEDYVVGSIAYDQARA